MLDYVTQKKIFRDKAKIIRAGLDTMQISKDIVNQVKDWHVYKNSRKVMLFSPINSEISLTELLNDCAKEFYFPVIENDKIMPVRYDAKLGFKIGKYNIPEPIGTPLDALMQLDLVFIPALAVDTKGCRLGYGKGYYDRFLSLLGQAAIKVVPIAKKLVYDSIPCELHDIPVDYIITEDNVILL